MNNHLQNNHSKELHLIEHLRHFLPAQAPIKEFIHHNSLHAFQHQIFYEALKNASAIFGYKLFLTLEEYRSYYKSGKIKSEVLKRKIIEHWGKANFEENLHKVLNKYYQTQLSQRIGALRAVWHDALHLDFEGYIYPTLFRIVGGYLDQGIAAWPYPYHEDGFIESIRQVEADSLASFFKCKETRDLLQDRNIGVYELLKKIVGDEHLFEQYLFDQQFGHQGWSGIVQMIELQPDSLYDKRKISLLDFIHLELLMEFDLLTHTYKKQWKPIAHYINKPIPKIFDDVADTELLQVFKIWQDALEWSYYDEALTGIISQRSKSKKITNPSFQAIFCIDDRSGSFRRYIEHLDKNCETFGTAGFFNVEFFYKPVNGKFYTKLCPAPVTPTVLIKEVNNKPIFERELHFGSHNYNLFKGWLITQTLGFWSAVKLFLNVFKPSLTPAMASSIKHIDVKAKLIIQNKQIDDKENGLQVGFTIPQMTDRVEGLLRSIGLTQNFAPIVYVVGHGASSVNNPHYSAYDCGACSGKPGSVNARVFSLMANNKEVRQLLTERGIKIPETTQFIAALHDTTRDEMVFYDEEFLSEVNYLSHIQHQKVFTKALALNAKERSRRFTTINTKDKPEIVWEKVKKRSVTIFEPRPELNHATNALCVIGSRDFTRDLFLDRRAFFNSYDYKQDPDGKWLFGILRAVSPVCGGINLEYFFSRMDNEKLGAGSKLPHNVVGLIAVANGTDGDLRPGLPSQMIDMHDPLRLLVIVEQLPEIVLEVIKQHEPTYEWYKNNWIHLACVSPANNKIYYFDYKHQKFIEYNPVPVQLPEVTDITPIIEENSDYLPVMIIKD